MGKTHEKSNTFLIFFKGERGFGSCRIPGVLPWSKAEMEAGLPHQHYQPCVTRKSQVIPYTAPTAWELDHGH